jgi:hypothetical protein
MCTVTGRRKGNSPLADERDPLIIERKREKKRGCRLGLLGCWAEGAKLLWERYRGLCKTWLAGLV